MLYVLIVFLYLFVHKLKSVDLSQFLIGKD